MVAKKGKKLVPELRFPGFDGEFYTLQVKQIFEKVSNPVKVEQNKEYQQIGIRSHGKGIFHKPKVLGETLGNKRVFWIEKDVFILNIVFAWEQAVAKTTNNEVGLVASHRFPMYRPIQDVTYLDYVLYFFLRKKGKYLLGLASPGGAGRNKTLGQKTFDELKVNVPSLPEQHKIASFLTAVDNKINKLTRKKELLEQYKKGVVQKIFSQEIRFKDENGKSFPDWEEKKVSDLYSFKSTNSLSREKLNYDEGDVKNIHYGDIHTKFYSLFDLTKENVPFINSDVSLLKISDEAYLNEGDIIIADASEDYDDIGKAIEIVNLDGKKVLAGLHTILGRQKTSDLFISYFAHFMKSRTFRLKVMKVSQGSKVLSISATRFSEITIELPNKDEQQKIAKFISAIDIKVNNIENEINKTQTFKKGLLQKLFV